MAGQGRTRQSTTGPGRTGQGRAEQVQAPQQGPPPLSPGAMCRELAQWLRIQCGGGPAESGICLQTQCLQATGFPAPMTYLLASSDRPVEQHCTTSGSSENTSKGHRWEQPVVCTYKMYV